MQNRAGEKVDRSVFFVPFLNQTEIPTAYAAGDVLVLPSFGSGETWGLVVNEAMNLGTPAIVSDHVGCGPDLVIPGETGWVFEAGGLFSPYASLAKTAGGSGHLGEMGGEAKKHIGEYSFAGAAPKLLRAGSKRGKKEGGGG